MVSAQKVHDRLATNVELPTNPNIPNSVELTDCSCLLRT
jgi:hypothetical protein